MSPSDLVIEALADENAALRADLAQRRIMLAEAMTIIATTHQAWIKERRRVADLRDELKRYR